MKGYDSYKKSKFQWFDEIPEHWIEGKIKYLFEISRGRVISQLELKPEAIFPVYSSQTKNDGCLGYIDTFDYEGEMLTWTTDGANAGSVFQRKGQFNCTNVCGILSPNKELELRYYFYYVDFIAQFYKRPDTNGAKIMSNEMAEVHCFIPSIKEQTKIAAFLDYKTNLIDATIEKKKKLIELLKEKRQAVINEAVTKGLNPNAKMKVSGVEWLREIPEHWKYSKLKWISNIYAGGTPSTSIDRYWENGNIPWLNSGTVNQKRIKVASNYITGEALLNSSTKWVPKNSILMALAGQGKTKGTVGILEIAATCNQSMAAIVPDEREINYEFLFYWLHSNYNRIRGLASSDQRDGLNLEIVGDIFCPIPSLEEQQVITTHLNNFDIKNDLVIEKLEIQIGKLQTYRQSLISEAVTGKIDVREWQINNN